MAGRIAIIGGGIGGLASALDLAARGREVLVLERAASIGGKIRTTRVGGVAIDAGPVALTMRWVFDALFHDAGTTLDAHVALTRMDVLGRHVWPDGSRLDLFADRARTADAIGAFAGPEAARGFQAFSARAKSTFDALEGPFLRASRPSPLSLVATAGLGRLMGLSPMTSLWDALGRHFADPRLRQLFGRTATYVGTSPLQAPATLMLVAQVEQDGVWLVAGGMQALPAALAAVATGLGATIRTGADVAEVLVGGGRVRGVRLVDGEVIEATSVIANADPAALAAGLFGAAAARAVPEQPAAKRSLSALTWALQARAEGFDLLRNTVFFPADAAAEYADLTWRGRLAAQPTITVSAQDREGDAAPGGPERLLVMVNAPARGDTRPMTAAEVTGYGDACFATLRRCGLALDSTGAVVTTPADFARDFPGTGGALYGQAVNGWAATFARPAAATKLPGLFLAGGSTHPGAGVAMAVLSGRLAAALA